MPTSDGTDDSEIPSAPDVVESGVPVRVVPIAPHLAVVGRRQVGESRHDRVDIIHAGTPFCDFARTNVRDA